VLVLVDRNRCARHDHSDPEAVVTTPTSVTLEVNDWSLTATKAKPAVYLHHEQDQPLPSRDPLSIRAKIDRPLPKGWKLTV
jgi:hypothetical protein